MESRTSYLSAELFFIAASGEKSLRDHTRDSRIWETGLLSPNIIMNYMSAFVYIARSFASGELTEKDRREFDLLLLVEVIKSLEHCIPTRDAAEIKRIEEGFISLLRVYGQECRGLRQVCKEDGDEASIDMKISSSIIAMVGAEAIQEPSQEMRTYIENLVSKTTYDALKSIYTHVNLIKLLSSGSSREPNARPETTRLGALQENLVSGGVNLEIDFHQQDKASVFIESTYSGVEKKQMEILTFCLHSLRMMCNLDPSHSVSLALAKSLVLVSEDIQSFERFVDSDDSTAQIVDYTGQPGRRRFTLKLRFEDGDLTNADMRQKGFGLFARGVGHYAPASVICLLKHLGRERRYDEEYLEVLLLAARSCGNVCLHDQLTISSQGGLAFWICSEIAAFNDGGHE